MLLFQFMILFIIVSMYCGLLQREQRGSAADQGEALRKQNGDTLKLQRRLCVRLVTTTVVKIKRLQVVYCK